MIAYECALFLPGVESSKCSILYLVRRGPEYSSTGLVSKKKVFKSIHIILNQVGPFIRAQFAYKGGKLSWKGELTNYHCCSNNLAKLPPQSVCLCACSKMMILICPWLCTWVWTSGKGLYQTKQIRLSHQLLPFGNLKNSFSCQQFKAMVWPWIAHWASGILLLGAASPSLMLRALQNDSN